MIVKSELAVKLINLRKQKGVSSEDVASALGLKGATYRRYEINTMPKSETYIALAEYFGVSVDYLIGNVSQLTVKSSIPYETDDNFGELSEAEMTVIKKLRSISHDDLMDALQYITDKQDVK